MLCAFYGICGVFIHYGDVYLFVYLDKTSLRNVMNKKDDLISYGNLISCSCETNCPYRVSDLSATDVCSYKYRCPFKGHKIPSNTVSTQKELNDYHKLAN